MAIEDPEAFNQMALLLFEKKMESWMQDRTRLELTDPSQIMDKLKDLSGMSRYLIVDVGKVGGFDRLECVDYINGKMRIIPHREEQDYYLEFSPRKIIACYSGLNPPNSFVYISSNGGRIVDEKHNFVDNRGTNPVFIHPKGSSYAADYKKRDSLIDRLSKI